MCDWPAVDAPAAMDLESEGTSSSPSAAFIFLFRGMGGALGSRGFRGFRAAFAMSAPSEVRGFTIVPGLRPGFFLGTPAAVNCTHWLSTSAYRLAGPVPDCGGMGGGGRSPWFWWPMC
jgi:hypothetical protein